MRSILLTEDDFLIRAVAVDALSDAGFSCIEAATGAAALDVLCGSQAVDAVIVDIGLPDMSGNEVIAASRRLRPGLPIIRCSGDGGPRSAVPAGVHVLRKPYTALELCELMTSLLGATAS